MIHRRNGKQWLSNLFWGRGLVEGVHKEYYKQCENSECNILLCCFQQHFCYEWKAKSDTLSDFKSFIQANNYLFIPNWYLMHLSM